MTFKFEQFIFNTDSDSIMQVLYLCLLHVILGENILLHFVYGAYCTPLCFKGHYKPLNASNKRLSVLCLVLTK